MIFAGTGYFLAMLVPGDGLYARARAWSLRVGESIVVTEAVLFETLNAMAHPSLRQVAISLLDQIVQSDRIQLIRVDAPLFARGCDLYRHRADESYSLTDCVSFVVMSDLGISAALTHDHHSEQAGFRALLREDPPAG